MKIKSFFIALVGSFFLLGCSSDDDANTEQITMSNLTLNLEGLENLGMSQVYEGWIIVGGAPVSTGTFTVNDNGVLSETSFMISTANLEMATAFVLSIEPANDSDPMPSDLKIISGNFSGNSAIVNTNEMIGDFSGVSGTFFLRTPTDEMMGAGNNMNDQYGVWFGDIDQGMPPVANFSLPMLDASKWIYEGWVVVDGTPLSTGRFSSFNMQDDFNGFSQTGGKIGPSLPGEDFFINPPMGIIFPLDVRGKMVVISVEPVMNDAPEPFSIKPLSQTAGMELVKNNSFMLNSGAIPSGIVTR